MTMMDLQSAVALGLHVRRAVNGDCGSYTVPGGVVDRDYAGIVERAFKLPLGSQVKFTLTGIRVTEQPFPLFLIRADILCGGKTGNSWNYKGFKLFTKPCGKVVGIVGFERGGDKKGNPLEREDCPLAQAATPPCARRGGLGSVASTFVAGTFRPSKV